MDEHLLQERRRFQRFLSRFPAKFKDVREDFGENLFLRDFSADGARLTSCEHLYLNDNITIEVEIPDGKNPLILRGRVVWVKSRDESHWDVGMEFHKVEFIRLARLYELTHPELMQD
jgi:hypothetical protein